MAPNGGSRALRGACVPRSQPRRNDVHAGGDGGDAPGRPRAPRRRHRADPPRLGARPPPVDQRAAHGDHDLARRGAPPPDRPFARGARERWTSRRAGVRGLRRLGVLGAPRLRDDRGRPDGACGRPGDGRASGSRVGLGPARRRGPASGHGPELSAQRARDGRIAGLRAGNRACPPAAATPRARRRHLRGRLSRNGAFARGRVRSTRPRGARRQHRRRHPLRRVPGDGHRGAGARPRCGARRAVVGRRAAAHRACRGRGSRRPPARRRALDAPGPARRRVARRAVHVPVGAAPPCLRSRPRHDRPPPRAVPQPARRLASGDPRRRAGAVGPAPQPGRRVRPRRRRSRRAGSIRRRGAPGGSRNSRPGRAAVGDPRPLARSRRSHRRGPVGPRGPRGGGAVVPRRGRAGRAASRRARRRAGTGCRLATHAPRRSRHPRRLDDRGPASLRRRSRAPDQRPLPGPAPPVAGGRVGAPPGRSRGVGGGFARPWRRTGRRGGARRVPPRCGREQR